MPHAKSIDIHITCRLPKLPRRVSLETSVHEEPPPAPVPVTYYLSFEETLRLFGRLPICGGEEENEVSDQIDWDAAQ